MELPRQKIFLYISAAFVGILAFLMAAPYISYILAGLLLAHIATPLHDFLTEKVDPRLSAGLMIVLTVLAAVLPFTLIGGVAGDEASNIINSLESAEGSDLINQAETLITDFTGQEVDIREKARSALSSVASYLPSSLSSALGLVAELAVGISLMLFAQFYALKDGRSLVGWTKEFDFMTDERQEMLYRSTSNSIKAVVKGHVLMAFAQGILAGIGLFFFGISNVLFWTLMMIVLGFIPMIGSALIWFPASLYLMLTGDLVSGALLLAYGVIVVGGADNFLRPLMVDDDIDIHSFFIILGLIGGVGLFGPIGIFIGPVIFGILKNLLDMMKEIH